MYKDPKDLKVLIGKTFARVEKFPATLLGSQRGNPTRDSKTLYRVSRIKKITVTYSVQNLYD